MQSVKNDLARKLEFVTHEHQTFEAKLHQTNQALEASQNSLENERKRLEEKELILNQKLDAQAQILNENQN